MNADEIRRLAQAELLDEDIRARVEAEKARLRTQRTWTQRLLALLPFTITIHRRTK